MQTLIFLFSACWLMLCFIKLKFNLHMLQIEGYKNQKYIDWMSAHKDKIFTKNDRIYSIIMIINTLFFMLAATGAEERNLSPYAMAASLITSVFLIINTKKKDEAKKPLVMTNRAKRLILIAVSLTVVDFLILIGIIYFISGNIVRYFPLWSGILAIVYLFSAYYVLGANYIAVPIEKNINKKFYNQASDKIKEMKNITSIGITGSYGKTSTKFAAASILKEKYSVLNTPESYNTPMGISKIINSKLTDEYEIFIAELGATKIGDIDEVAALTNPKIGILTSIGPCHLETFKSIDNIMRTKYELIERLPDDGIAIFNYDNDYVKKLADKTFKEKICYGIKNIEDTDLFATDIKVGSTGSKFTLCIKDMGTVECETKLLGEHNILNILAGASVAKVLGLTLDEIARGISKIESVEHRLQLIDPGTGAIVIDDAFNSNPDGAKAALEVLDSFAERRKIIVTPGMVELGEVEEQENEKFGENIAITCDAVILIGKKRTEAIQRGLKKKAFNEDDLYVVNSLSEATEVLKTLTRAGDVVLFENDLPDTYNEH
ncbi:MULTISPECIES: UDP-N-acetylmuramoyl-tripeptide--D-alanyl-D-alanine ligase [unclassified Sedimentibacter]|uniref:UDP-N-acetylmuramoyl-tripeptide--D-alanyl-D- alanine ligase n=1 Tax=unclassified Sedimentibacter TaxID=2649220 RepID=UPI0027E1C54E|nr:UDP-N-acetylmuramoyl-tripeptide--D-alanyl-D-alanine ligase [Sedimentibacter sp. MB35-C1]WMJ76364.1 UDP-N-acetylmuramoyl-tripeptide--D-alanyl-D-alanine ligase [Sedimentibacter sp. MB35-C1]